MTSPTGARPAPDTEMTDLVALYARHAPDLERMPGDAVPLLLAAARSHLQLASWRTQPGAADPGLPARPRRGPRSRTTARRRTVAGGLVVEIVTDDMPFLVESVQAAAVRAGCEVQRVIHPIVVVRRTESGDLAEVLTAADPATRRPARWPSPGSTSTWSRRRSARPSSRPRWAGCCATSGPSSRTARRWSRRARELADALPTGAGGRRAAPARPTSRSCCAGWPTATSPSSATATTRPATTGDTAELRPDLSTGLGALGPASSVSATFAPRVDTVDDLDDVLVITRANAISPLRAVHPYYLAVRTVEPGGRLVGEHRFLGHADRVRAVRERAGHPGRGGQGPRGDPVRRVPAAVLLRPGHARGDLRAAPRGAVQRERADPARHRGRGAGHGRAACGAAVPAPRPVPPVHLRAGLPAARPLHHRVPAGHGRGAAAPARRPLGRGHRAGLRVQPGARPVHRAHRARRCRLRRRHRRRRAAGRAHRRGPHLGRPAARPAGHRRAGAAAARRVRGLQGGRRPAARGRGPAPHRRARRPRRLRRAALLGHRRRRTSAGSPCTWPAPRPPSPRCCRCCSSSGWTCWTSVPAEFTRADGVRCWLYDFGLRLDEADHGRDRRALRGRARAGVLLGVPGGLARRRGDRLVRRAGAAGRAALAGGRGAARLRPLRPPARQLLRADLRGRHPAGQPGHGARPDGAVPGPVRPGRRRPGRRGRARRWPRCRARSTRSPAWTRTASCAATWR